MERKERRKREVTIMQREREGERREMETRATDCLRGGPSMGDKGAKNGPRENGAVQRLEGGTEGKRGRSGI